jgi:hypothetical protein
MIYITVFRIHTVFLVHEMLDHSRLDATRDVESDVLNDLVIGYKVSIFDFQVVRVVHEHPFASYVLVLLWVPPESHLDWAVN